MDVTRTAFADRHTGIQKVVRGLLSGLSEHAATGSVDVVPVLLADGSLVALPGLEPHRFELMPALDAGRRGFGHWDRAKTRLLRIFRAWFGAVRNMKVLTPLRPLLRDWRNRWRYLRLSRRTVPIALRPSDVLLLADASWLLEPWPAIAAVKATGGKVVVVWYDLIPVHHPDLFEPELVKLFETYLARIMRQADLVIAISQTVSGQLKDYCAKAQIPAPPLCSAWPSVVLSSHNAAPRADMLRLFNRPAVLVVSTIEPRKGHSLLLDACERLWEGGIDFNLVIIGRTGWRVDKLMERIQTHPQAGHRLFHVDNASDQDVAFALSRAHALAFPSRAEGLGLPIIEAELAGCPVVCSDIAVFREVGSANTTFFSPYDADALAVALGPLLSKPRDLQRAERNPADFSHAKYAEQVLQQILSLER